MKTSSLVFFGFCCFLLIVIFYHPRLISAHEEGIQWLSVNGKAITDNTTQNPSKLSWDSHIAIGEFNADEPIEFKANAVVLEKKVKQNSEDFKIVWTIDEEELEGSLINKVFEETGNYTVQMKVIKNSDGTELESETFMITVGDLPDAPIILVNGLYNGDGIYNIKRKDILTFGIQNPNDTYTYIWDLSEEDLVFGGSAEKRFGSTKLPAYIILRSTDTKTNVFRDSYIRLETEDAPEYEVVMPPIKIDDDAPILTTTETNTGINPVLPFSAAVFVIIMGTYLVVKSIRKVSRK